MNFCQFLDLLNKANFKSEIISSLFIRYASDIPSDYDETTDKTSVQTLISSLSDEAFSSFSSKLNACLSICSASSELIAANDIPQEQIEIAKSAICDALAIYDEIACEKYNKPESDNNENFKTIEEEHNKKLKEINDRVKDLNDEVKQASELIDEKVFNLLINTVGILGIFVAIAFAGFGTFSIFQNVNLEVAFASKSAFMKSVFFVLLVGWTSYNLLLLLIYFIFKLSRPILDKKIIQRDGSDHGGKERYRDLVSLSRFLWIDLFLFILVLVMFFVSCKAS